jgi:tetratricopeptide (TPR) repeat protein
MKFPLTALALLLSCSAALGQHDHHNHGAPAGANAQPVRLIAELGAFHFPVANSNAEAQKFFDQGVILVYGFNHDEAARSFRRASQLAPLMPMAHWGIAMALGPNYNEKNIPPARLKAAHEAAQWGLALAQSAKAPAHERAYLEALAKRFSADANADQSKLWTAYRDAMRELMTKYPDDLDAATLWADAAMIINAWKLWSPQGKPAEGTEEIVAVLESVMRRDPTHIGAHHLYIHAVEASPYPERATQSADLLARLSPAAGHLVHMPAHTYMRVGDYEAAARSNEWAAKADEEYLANGGLRGVYSAGYYSHNLHFLAAAHSMQGRYADAVKASRRLEENVRPYLKDIPSLEGFMPTGVLIMARFGRWDDVLKEPEPDKSMPVTGALWHWARGMAYAAKGKAAEAEGERKILTAAAAAIPAEMNYGPQNTARSVLKIAEHFLDSRVAAARGDRRGAVESLRRAVEAEDALAYDEPPGWYHPLSRESLGGALMLDGRHEEAERVFREDLRRNRRNGRSLFGLAESLKAQGKTREADLVYAEFERAWKNADTKLRVEDL